MRNNKKKELHIRVNKPVLKLMLLCVILFLFHFLLYEPIEISKEYITPFSSSEGIENDFWGLMFSGYYVRLEEGEYYITYYGENENPNAYVNVLMDTSELLYEAIYEPGQSIRITIPEGIHTVEPRMYWRAGGNTAVESIRIEPVFTPLFCIKHGCIYFLIAFVIIGLHIVCNEKETKKKWVIVFLDVFVISILEFISFESLCLDETVYKWINRFGAMSNGLIFILINIGIIILINLFLFFFTGNLFITGIVSSLVLKILALTEYNYYLLRGESFSFELIKLVGEARDVGGDYKYTLPKLFTISVLIELLCLILISDVKIRVGLPWRFANCILVIGISSALYMNMGLLIEKAGGSSQIFVLREYNECYGFLIGFVSTMPRPMYVPEGYSNATVNSFLKKCGNTNSVSEYPDIIFIQDESLSDIHLVMEYKESENPLDGLASMGDDLNVGNMLSPMSGGGTCNVEFEVLTGTPYSNVGGTPFVDGLPQKTESLVSILNSLGYETVSIHTNTGSFFNRTNTYRTLGFDKSIFSENFVIDTNGYWIGNWLNDRYAFDTLIEQYEERDKSVPFFGYVVTTQNHGAYTFDYDEWGITVDGDLTEDGTRELQTFLNLERESVDALRDLRDYFLKNDKKVIIVYYGDHCPGYYFFSSSTVTEKDNKELLSHFTPLVIWDSYGLDFNLSENDVLAAYNVSPYVLNKAGMSIDRYMNYSYINSIPNVYGSYQINNVDSYCNIENWLEHDKNIWQGLQVLQYDKIYGKHYGRIE